MNTLTKIHNLSLEEALKERYKKSLYTRKSMSIKEVAEELGKSQQFVRIGIQRGLLPFGTAQVVSGEKYSYYISPQKFYDFIRKTTST